MRRALLSGGRGKVHQARVRERLEGRVTDDPPTGSVERGKRSVVGHRHDHVVVQPHDADPQKLDQLGHRRLGPDGGRLGLGGLGGHAARLVEGVLEAAPGVNGRRSHDDRHEQQSDACHCENDGARFHGSQGSREA